MASVDLDWIAQGPLALPNNLDKMPKDLEKLLLKFDLEKKTKFEDHIDDFYMHLQILKVCLDNVSCRLYQYTLEGRLFLWDNNLLTNSI